MFILLLEVQKSESPKGKKAFMGKEKRYMSTSLLSVIIILGLVSFTLCVAAEFKRSKKEDLRFDGQLCFLPKSVAFGLGIMALVFTIVAQVIGNLLICRKFLPKGIGGSSKAKIPKIATIFLVISWMSFGVFVILLSAATSMSQPQRFGEGWVDGECYVVRDGVFIGSGMLVLITISSVISSAIITIRKGEVEQVKKVDANAQLVK